MIVKRKKNDDVTIRLSYQDAEILNGVLRNVAGEHMGPRGTITQIANMLTSQGIAPGDRYIAHVNPIPGVTFLKVPE